ncbi:MULTISPECIES: alanine/glycine:cation symporter family protein [Bacillus]|uniref:Sodium:alanine symporter n=2 Tax=Bacillus TaxID=1386 RepID=A0A0M3RA00_9BACI|nr:MULTISPECIES: alanine/glycine:cation symporter family protein [Bacillus]ALC82322.1 sodium:alanine symporter [Bacillus gobiensis]MBP1081187.1 AGCS family alanine or glycine:cation symporter [Bacillus capparidis]MED1095868.1 alanine/glycine:cation symporter family protein [Bacillus capparidis]
MEQFLEWLVGIVWSSPLVWLCAVIGLLLTGLTGFVQLRYLKDMIIQTFTGKSSKEGVSSFQAISIALSGRVGTGNIAGVAAAIYAGGPGAVFWMWFIGFVGAASSFAESTLGQIYKKQESGQYRGGPAYYIDKALGLRWYAVIFAIAAMIATALFAPGIQANSISSGLKEAFGVPNVVSGIVMTAILALIIIGGVKSIASVAQFVVPFMAVGYILVSLIVIGLNIEQVPAVLELIFSSAFGANAMFGGIVGTAISFGIQRGVYSNEAGQGTGPHAAAAAEVSHPVKQGLVQAFSIYIDTLFVCSATALMILFTNSFNTVDAGGNPIASNVLGADGALIEGTAQYTQEAVESVIPGFGSGFVAIALCFFAFTTIMAQYYIAETNMVYILKGKFNKIFALILKLALIATTLIGALWETGVTWLLADLGVGMMAWLNLIALLFLIKPVLRALKDYREQKLQGLDPIFTPSKLGIKNADYWEKEYVKKRKRIS